MSTAVPTQPETARTYEQFYGFAQPPFALAPDPRFFYRSESHDEAITQLLQAIRRREGHLLLTGDIGIGKTTICRTLLEQLDATTFTALVLNPFVSVEELLREVLLDFGVVSRETVRSGRIAAATVEDLTAALHEFLRSLAAIRSSALLIIDEAQHLSPAVLEQIRIISNLETGGAKLLQIVLVGQPALLDVLAQTELRELDRRISLRAALKPLTRDEIGPYIAHRLWTAEAASPVQFEPEAVDLVSRLTGGVPRVINLVCHRALMAGAETGSDQIAPALIEQAALGLGLTQSTDEAAPAPANLPWKAIAAAVLAGGLAVAAFLAWRTASAADTAPPPPHLALARIEPAGPKPLPSVDFLPPPLPAPRPARVSSSREVPDDQVGLRVPR